ncbi:MAG: hypothetical protein ATN33_08690 [Epulopiscium sp. Nele67-Bin001]|nr:MAG: hypothetical protein ATN33_08690 [Epulopiscium sp. Nele67-Bin001]
MLKFNNNNIQAIQVPVWFIRDFLHKSHGSYIKVYLIINSYSQQGTDIAVKNVAQQLDMLESEVNDALRYWDSQGVLKIDENKNVTFVLEDPAAQVKPKTFRLQMRPEYSQAELNIIREHNQSINELFLMAEQCLGKMLSPTDQKVIYGFYDWLNMPIDLIEYLFEYCLSNNHTQLKYIEKVATSWNDDDIKSVDEAKAQVIKNQDHYKILKSLGMSSAIVSPAQEQFFDKWLKEYRLPLNVILEGCNRTVSNIQKPNLNYLDTILTKWHEQGVKILEDIEALDKKYQVVKEQKVSKEPPQRHKIVSKTQPFYAMSSHNLDYNEIDRLERQYHEKIRESVLG